MNGFVYWGFVLGVTAIGTLLVWVFFSAFQRTNTASGKVVLPSLFIRIVRAGTIALFLTPSLAGWFPCPYILAVIWAVVAVGSDPIGCMQYLLPLTKIYLGCWVIIFFVIEKFFTPRQAPEAKA